MSITKQQRCQAAVENASFPEHLIKIDKSQWIAKSWDNIERIEVWRSKHFLVQIFAEKNGAQRITVSRTELLKNGHWQPGITWDDLQRLKQECGRGEHWAVEIYPAESDLVNVANMRHLWLLPEKPAYAWAAGRSATS
jgi:hypothetical protein